MDKKYADMWEGKFSARVALPNVISLPMLKLGKFMQSKWWANKFSKNLKQNRKYKFFNSADYLNKNTQIFETSSYCGFWSCFRRQRSSLYNFVIVQQSHFEWFTEKKKKINRILSKVFYFTIDLRIDLYPWKQSHPSRVKLYLLFSLKLGNLMLN